SARTFAMAQANPAWPTTPDSASPGGLPTLRLEVLGNSRATTYDVSESGFLIGTVPGCDLRVPGVHLPPVICLIARFPKGAAIRKLVATQTVLVNGRPISNGLLHDGDRVSLGAVELLVHSASAGPASDSPLPPDPKTASVPVHNELVECRQRIKE